MGFNKKFFQTGGIVASSPAAAAITGTDHFSPVTYTGTGSTQSITSLDFAPDLVWVKSRGSVRNHMLSTSVQQQYNYISTNLTNAEATSSARITSLDSSGFTVGTSANVNSNGVDYVGWCWKAGGAAVTNTDGVTSGSVTAVTSTVSANADAGFSINKFTTPSSGFPSWGHGLSSAPELIIIKATGVVQNWIVYAPSILGQKDGYLNATSAFTSYSPAIISVDSSKIDLGRTGYGLSGNSDYIAYCFHSVDGYQKVGTYTATGSAGSPRVYTTDDGTSSGSGGFQPRFLMVKNIDKNQEWIIVDYARNNGANSLQPNSSNAENTTGANEIDFNADGFTIAVSGSGVNYQAGDTFIYLAIA